MPRRPRLLKRSEIEAMSEKEILEEIFADKTAVGIFYAGAAWTAFLVTVVNLFRGPPYDAILVAPIAAIVASFINTRARRPAALAVG